MTDRAAKWFFGGLLIVSLALLAKGAWLYVKAELAQVLLARAWAETRSAEHEVKPWVWADMWPVARLRAPGLGVSRLVLGVCLT